MAGLADESSSARVEAIGALAASGAPEAAALLQALSEGRVLTADGRVLVRDAPGGRMLDAVTGGEVTPAPEAAEDLTVNNRVRRALAGALAGLRLVHPEVEVRLAAARALVAEPRPEAAPLLARALEAEKDGRVRRLLELAGAELAAQDPDPARRLEGARALGASGLPAVKALLTRLSDPRSEPDEQVRAAATASLRKVELRVWAGELLAELFSGLSLGSVLLLAALGLAITYGVMGVINMAHGELLMVGAYAAYTVQSLLARHAPGALAWYPLLALPVAFGAAALVGAAMERTVIRRLYGRPLETLLATWGLSLVLIQAARVAFGAQNVQVANPSWLSGGITIVGGAVLPWNRIVIVAFALGVLALVWLLLNRTRLGMYVRAVTQNRGMAACVGVPTGRLDTTAFALGSGVAGLGGVALSQIANVGPDMGQAYIVDAFMVVVLGGVGQLAGAVGAALGLGVDLQAAGGLGRRRGGQDPGPGGGDRLHPAPPAGPLRPQGPLRGGLTWTPAARSRPPARCASRPRAGWRWASSACSRWWWCRPCTCSRRAAARCTSRIWW